MKQISPDRITPYNITELKPGEIFVFGSNLAGRHGAGAALTARRLFGATTGRGTGLMGQSYGIATKDQQLRSLPLEDIGTGISLFLGFAFGSPQKRFLVTAIGCGLASYAPAQIVPLFFKTDYVPGPDQLPKNITLPASFWVEMGK